MFYWEHWGFHLETGYDLHTFFQNLRNNEKKRKAHIGNSFRIKEENIQGIQTFKYKGERFDHVVSISDNRIPVSYERVPLTRM